MRSERKIALVVSQIQMDDENQLDVAFWLRKTPAERLSEVFRLRQDYFKWAQGEFPQKMIKAVNYRTHDI
jgi:hypothetical protein